MMNEFANTMTPVCCDTQKKNIINRLGDATDTLIEAANVLNEIMSKVCKGQEDVGPTKKPECMDEHADMFVLQSDFLLKRLNQLNVML